MKGCLMGVGGSCVRRVACCFVYCSLFLEDFCVS